MANEPKCQQLDDNLKRCKRNAVYQIIYHGDRGIYTFNGRPDCVLVGLCKTHLADLEDDGFVKTRRRPK
jgi:hypothetical protein